MGHIYTENHENPVVKKILATLKDMAATIIMIAPPISLGAIMYVSVLKVNRVTLSTSRWINRVKLYALGVESIVRMDKLDKYKPGIQGIRYKPVSARLRRELTTRNMRKRRLPQNQMVIDLLAGRTLFAYSEPGRKRYSFGSLYTVAANNNRTLRIYGYDDVDDEIFRGYLIWMERRVSI